MLVFIAWSGRGRALAEAVKDWIQDFNEDFQENIRVFVSTQDVKSGDEWEKVVTWNLKRAEYGILCVTGDTMSAPWLNYEAGGLHISGAIHSDQNEFSVPVVPILFDSLKRGDLISPLSHFHSRVFEKSDLTAMFDDLNSVLRAHNRRTKEEISAWIARKYPLWCSRLLDTHLESLVRDAENTWFRYRDIVRDHQPMDFQRNAEELKRDMKAVGDLYELSLTDPLGVRDSVRIGIRNFHDALSKDAEYQRQAAERTRESLRRRTESLQAAQDTIIKPQGFFSFRKKTISPPPVPEFRLSLPASRLLLEAMEGDISYDEDAVRLCEICMDSVSNSASSETVRRKLAGILVNRIDKYRSRHEAVLDMIRQNQDGEGIPFFQIPNDYMRWTAMYESVGALCRMSEELAFLAHRL